MILFLKLKLKIYNETEKGGQTQKGKGSLPRYTFFIKEGEKHTLSLVEQLTIAFFDDY